MRKRILIIEVNWVGDVLFSTPFIRAVREAYPDSHVACLIHPRTKEVLLSNPRIDELIEYNEEGSHKGLFGKMALVSSLRRKRFDTAFILHRSFTKALLAYAAGIEERIGYPEKKRAILLTKAVDLPSEGLHKVDYFLEIAKASGIKPGLGSYEFFVKEHDRVFADSLIRQSAVAEGQTLMTICPGGNWAMKRWPKERFALLADALAGRYGAKVAITGTAKDVKLAGEIKAKMKSEPVITCGKTTLGQLAAILERSALVIANDTGPMHLAVSVRAPVVALFGPTSPALTGPYGKGTYRVVFKNEKCDAPCYDVTCRDNRCMADISVEDVLEAADGLIGSGAEKR